MPIRVHVSQLSDEELLAKLGVKRRAKPRELERPHQVALIKWVRTVKDTLPSTQTPLRRAQWRRPEPPCGSKTQGRRRTGRRG